MASNMNEELNKKLCTIVERKQKQKISDDVRKEGMSDIEKLRTNQNFITPLKTKVANDIS